MQWKKTENAWITPLEDGTQLEWKNFGVGPLNLNPEERAALCQQLLNIEVSGLSDVATQALEPFAGNIDKSLILHSTSTDLGAFPGDFTKLKLGLQAKNYAGYVETRAPFLGKEGDLAVGRMASWKISATKAGIRQLDISNLSHYYLSDVLLILAAQHQETPVPVIVQLIDYLKTYPHAVIRLYVLDQSFQIFLSWLKQQTGLKQLYIDANSPAVAANWNTKSCLYPTVAKARNIEHLDIKEAHEVLALERQATPFYDRLGLHLPGLPGYVIQRANRSLSDFCQQLLDAAILLKKRYGLEKGCLKACDSGDGARITPNIDLTDEKRIMALGATAYAYGDDYVLESHVNYSSASVGKQEIKLTPSAHIRAGKLAAGITLQFTKGTSWVGNLYVDEQLAPQLGISADYYRLIRNTMEHFLDSCQKQGGGLVIGGIDFSIGRLGGRFGDDVLLGVQDPNISFNGAEFLREFMNRASIYKNWETGTFYAATWVFVPHSKCTHDVLETLLSEHESLNTHSSVIAVVPNYWAMIGVAALTYDLLIEHLERLQMVIEKDFII